MAYMPHAWVIQADAFIRVGFEAADMGKCTVDDDMIAQIETMFRMAHEGSVGEDDDVSIQPVVPQTDEQVDPSQLTVKQFVARRGWYSVSVSPSTASPSMQALARKMLGVAEEGGAASATSCCSGEGACSSGVEEEDSAGAELAKVTAQLKDVTAQLDAAKAEVEALRAQLQQQPSQ